MLYCYRIPGGFPVIKQSFPNDTSISLPMNCDIPPFDSKDTNIDSHLSIVNCTKFVRALDSLPKPVLVSCISGARASAIVAVYVACKNRWTAAEMKAFSEAQGTVLYNINSIVNINIHCYYYYCTMIFYIILHSTKLQSFVIWIVQG